MEKRTVKTGPKISSVISLDLASGERMIVGWTK
jgi:hypothetical protein